MIRLIVASFLLTAGTALANESVGSCTFSYNDDVESKFSSVDFVTGLRGFDNLNRQIFSNMCGDFPNSSFYLHGYRENKRAYDLEKSETYRASFKADVQGCTYTVSFQFDGKNASMNDDHQTCASSRTGNPYRDIQNRSDGSFTGHCIGGQRFSGERSDGTYVVSGPSRTAIQSTKLEAIRSACGS